MPVNFVTIAQGVVMLKLFREGLRIGGENTNRRNLSYALCPTVKKLGSPSHGLWIHLNLTKCSFQKCNGGWSGVFIIIEFVADSEN